MDTLHPQMMQGINTGHTDDEMMDSEFDNQVQPDDDYDIDLDVADAFSNNADEEMKEDVPVSYDNDDVMVDEVEFQTQQTQLVPDTQAPHEEMIFSQMHPAHPLERQEYRQFNITETTQVPATSAADAVITDTTTEPVAEQTLASLEPVAVESAEVTIEVTQESKDVPAITVTDVPNVENSGTEAVQAQSNNPESEQNEKENGAVPSTEVSKGAEEGDAAAVGVASPHGEAQDGDNQAADTNPTTERRDSIASNAEVQKIHPVIVQFGSEILALFNAQYYINYNDTPDNPTNSTSNGFPAAFLVSDFSLYNKGFDEVFAVLRELFGPSIGDDAELTLEFDGLELFLHEDNSMSGNITPCELVDLYVRLSLQDKVQHPDPLYIVLATQPRFTKRYSELLSAAGDGKGLSAVATYSTPADEHHDEDDNKQSYGQSENKDGDDVQQFEESQNTDQNKPGQGDAQEEEFEQVDHAQDEEEDIPDLTEEEQQQLQIADDSLLMLGGVAPVIEGNNKNIQVTDTQPHPAQEEDDDELLPEEDQLEAEGNPVAAEAQEILTEKADTTKTSEPKSTDDNKDHSQKVDENSQSVGQESKDNLIEETQSQTIQEASIDVNANDHTDIEDVGENEFLDYDPSELPPAVEGKDDYNEQTEAQAEDVSPHQEDEEYEQAEGNEGENNEDEDGEYVEDDTFYTVGTSHTVTINSSNADVDYEDQSFVSAVVVTGASPTSHGSPESGTVTAQTPASDKLQPITSYQGDEEPDAEDELRSYQDEDEPRAGSQEPDYEHQEGDENWDENTAKGGSFEENENQLEGNGEEEEDAEYEDDDGDYTAEGEENRGLTNESTDGTVPVSEGGVKEGEKTSPQEEEVLEEYDDAGSYEDFQRQFDAQEKLRETNSPVNKRERADDDELYEYETHDVKRTRSD